MQLPLTDPDTLFEELLQDLPSETVQMARACKAFVRAKKVKTPAQLLRVVFLSLQRHLIHSRMCLYARVR